MHSICITTTTTTTQNKIMPDIENDQVTVSLEKVNNSGNSIVIKDISNKIDVNRPASVLEYGNDLQKKLGDFSNEILNGIQKNDNSEINHSISDLLNEITSIEQSSESGIMSKIYKKIPILRKTVNGAKNMITKYEGVKSNIDDIVLKIDSNRLTLAQDNNALGDLYVRNLEYMKELQNYVLGAKMKREEIQAELDAIDSKSLDIDEQLRSQDLKAFLTRLDRKIQNLTTTGTVALQSLPQIRIIQENNAAIMEKVDATVNNTIPMWKNQIVISTALNRQQGTIEMQRKVDETTNKMLLSNSENLKNNAIKVAQANERDTVDIDTLKSINSNLMSTLNEIQKVNLDGDKQRKIAANEINKIHQELHNFMASKDKNITN